MSFHGGRWGLEPVQASKPDILAPGMMGEVGRRGLFAEGEQGRWFLATVRRVLSFSPVEEATRFFEGVSLLQVEDFCCFGVSLPTAMQSCMLAPRTILVVWQVRFCTLGHTLIPIGCGGSS